MYDALLISLASHYISLRFLNLLTHDRGNKWKVGISYGLVGISYGLE